MYLEKLRELLLYTDVSDCKMEEGSMRCDVNVSISKTEKLGTRTEIKNIGSVHSVGLAIDAESKRQEEVLEQGGMIREETRRFDESINQTILMRVKEIGNDYRYFPEPDIPKLKISEERIEQVKKQLPMLPDERRKVYLDLGILPINCDKLIQNKPLSDFFNTLLGKDVDFVVASNLLLGDISAYLNKNNQTLEKTTLSTERFVLLLSQLKQGVITNKIVKDILPDFLTTLDSIEALMEQKGIKNMNDASLLIEIIRNIIKQNPDSVKDYQEGKDRALKFLMGQVMKETKGSANPALASQLLKEELSKQ